MTDKMKEMLADKSRVLSDVEKDFFDDLFYNLSKMKIDQHGALDDNGIPFRHEIQDFVVAWTDYLSEASTEDTGGTIYLGDNVNSKGVVEHRRLYPTTQEPIETEETGVAESFVEEFSNIIDLANELMSSDSTEDYLVDCFFPLLRKHGLAIIRLSTITDEKCPNGCDNGYFYSSINQGRTKCPACNGTKRMYCDGVHIGDCPDCTGTKVDDMKAALKSVIQAVKTVDSRGMIVAIEGDTVSIDDLKAAYKAGEATK